MIHYMNFIDLGECEFYPIQPITLNERIENIVREIENNYDFVNIIANEDATIQFLGDFVKHVNIDNSISIMHNYKIITLHNKINYNKPMLILNCMRNVNAEEMNIRLFSTMSYRFTFPIYVSLLKSNESDYFVYESEDMLYDYMTFLK